MQEFRIIYDVIRSTFKSLLKIYLLKKGKHFVKIWSALQATSGPTLSMKNSSILGDLQQDLKPREWKESKSTSQVLGKFTVCSFPCYSRVQHS